MQPRGSPRRICLIEAEDLSKFLLLAGASPLPHILMFISAFPRKDVGFSAFDGVIRPELTLSCCVCFIPSQLISYFFICMILQQ
jgi:hypothetical protein